MGVDSHHRAFYSSCNAVSPPQTLTTKSHQPPVAVTVRPTVIYLMTKTCVVSSAGFDCDKWLWITGNKWKELCLGITNAWFQVQQRCIWLGRMSMSCHWLCLQAEISVNQKKKSLFRNVLKISIYMHVTWNLNHVDLDTFEPTQLQREAVIPIRD